MTSGTGTCTLTASQAGDGNYNPATDVVRTVTAQKANQTITFTSIAPDSAVVGETYDPTATGGASSNPVTFTIDTSALSVCSISGGTVSFDAEGICVINANQAGDANYNAAPQDQQSFGISLYHQTISEITNAVALATDTVVGQSYPVTFSVTPKTGGGTPTGNVTVSDGTDSCTDTVADGTCDLTSTTAGTKSLTATYAGDSHYAGSVSSVVPHTVNEAPAIFRIYLPLVMR
jgi:hypothetical protein